MGKKAVYNKQYLAIYITGEDFDGLLRGGSTLIPVLIGSNPEPLAWINFCLQSHARDVLKVALDAERQAIREIQDQFEKDHPDYTSSTDIQRRQKRARKRLRKRTNDVD